MTSQLFTNVTIFDGTGRAPFPGEVLIEGNRIRKVAEGRGQIARDAASVVDGQGMTLMPGMTEGHCHISFTGIASPAALGELPPEEHTLATMHNAKLLFDHGFTSVYCAASAKPRLDVVIRNEINAGPHPGAAHPRREPRDHGHRGPRRRAQAAPLPRELRADRGRRRRDAPDLPDLHPRRRRQPQDQHLGRRVRDPLQGRDDRDDGRRDQRPRSRSRTTSASRSPATRAPRARSSARSGTAST